MPAPNLALLLTIARMVGTGSERELGSGEEPRGAGLVVGVLERLADIGARPEDSHDERLRAGALILASVGIALISFVWVLTYLAFDEPLAAAIPATFQVVTLVGLVVLARTKRFDIFRTTQLAGFLLLPALLQVALGGFAASSGMVLWGSGVPCRGSWRSSWCSRHSPRSTPSSWPAIRPRCRRGS